MNEMKSDYERAEDERRAKLVPSMDKGDVEVLRERVDWTHRRALDIIESVENVRERVDGISSRIFSLEVDAGLWKIKLGWSIFGIYVLLGLILWRLW